MINFHSLQIPPPLSWQEFETLCCDLWRNIWSDPNTTKNGRSGQKQQGVDIYGRSNGGVTWAGVQCKGKDNFTNQELTESEIKSEIQKAKSFNPPLSEFIIATSGPKDAKLELLARTLTAEHQQNGLFTIHIWGWRDIVERLADYPELVEKHYPHLTSSQFAEPSYIERLLNSSIKIYNAMGYKLISIERKNNSAVLEDLSARRYKLWIADGEISQDFIFSCLKDASHLTPILVTQRRIAPGARETAKANGVEVFSIEDLYKLLLEADELEKAYLTSNSLIKDSYVDLCAERRVYDSAGYLKYTENYDPLDLMLDNWLEEEGKNQITLLGDYGTGKTWFCLHFAKRLMSDAINDRRSRIPILVSLRSCQRDENIADFIVRAIREQLKISVDYGVAAIDRANEDGRLIFILDGFDEMPNEVDGSGMVDNFNKIASIVGPRSKIIVTCRRQYFRNNRELFSLVDSVGREGIIDLQTRPNFEILHLKEFSIPQIQEVLKKREGANWRRTYNRILKVYDLPELARRPVLLDIIISNLPDVPETDAVNPALLYQIYTSKWLAREEERGGVQITPELKGSFTEELAWQMFNSQKVDLKYSDLPAHIKSYFTGTALGISESLVREIQQQSFLQRNEDDKFRFAHRSFMEFFVAKRLLKSVEENNYTDFNERPLSTEIMSFIRDLLELKRTNLYPLLQFVLTAKNKPFSQVGYGPSNGLSLLAACRYDLRDKDFSQTVLRNVNLQNSDLSNSDFSFGDLQGAKLQHAVMSNTILFGADMHSTVIGESNVVRGIQSSKDGDSLVCAGSGGSVYKLDARNGNMIARIPQVSNARVIATSSKLNEFVTGGVDGRIRLWSWEDVLLQTTMIGDEFSIFAMAVDSGQQWLVTGAQGGTILLWSLDNKEIVKRYPAAHLPYVRSLCFLPQGKTFASGGADNSVKVWNISGGHPVVLNVGGLPYALECSPDGKWLYCGTNEPAIEIWATNTWNCIEKLKQHTDTVTGFARHPNNLQLMSVGRDGQACLWDIESNKLKFSSRFDTTIMTACFIGSGEVCAFGFNNGKIRACNSSNLKNIWEFQISDSDFACTGMDIRKVKGFAPEWIKYMRELGAITEF